MPEKPRLRDIIGPGLITGAADDDPSGIATYSQVGAQFGYGLGWALVLSYPLMCAIQQISGEIGRVTGDGIAGNLRRHMPRGLLYGVVSLLIVANTINLGADLGAMGAALRLLIGGPAALYVTGFAAISVLLEVFVSYDRYVGVLKYLCLSLLAYVAAVFVIHVPWGSVVLALVWPHFSANTGYLTSVVAVLGTTISPYLFFWQAQEEAEDQLENPDALPLTQAPEQAPNELRRIRLDTYSGMAISNIIALFVVITTAATLHAHGVTDISTSAQAAEALRPIAGPFAFTVFAAGIIGTGLLAVPVLAGSAAYALGEARDWPVGLARTLRQAPAFYGAIVVATLLGALMTISPINPVRALFYSAVVNGVVSVPVMAAMMVMAARPAVMGPFTIKPALRVMGWLATGMMGLAALGMFATL